MIKLKSDELFRDAIEHENWKEEKIQLEAIVYKEKYKKCEDSRHSWPSIDKTIILNVNGKHLCPQHAKGWLSFFERLGEVIKGNIKKFVEALKAKLRYYE